MARKLLMIAALMALAATAFGAAGKPRWNELEGYTFDMYVKDYAKPHRRGTAEYEKRAALFESALKRVRAHNELPAQTYKKGINHLSDWTEEELARIRGNKVAMKKFANTKAERLHERTAGPLPKFVDWRNTQPAVLTAVKDQGQCGSCWAFSTTGSSEGAIQIAHGQLTSLSEQELVDCGGTYGNLGCNGGLMDRAFKYMEANGLCTEAAYPYKAVGGTCQKSSCTASAYTHLSGYKDVTTTENALGAAVDIGPVSVAIEADQAGFQLYKSGVFSGACGQTLDHGVLTVGYGTDSGQDYWKVKNSWGTSWGEQGYIRMIRNKDECGIANEPSYPLSG